jgi:uncharacterized protein YgiM (DUF1202 family)
MRINGERTMKRCPYCAEEIQEQAVFCRYCRRDLPALEEAVHQEENLGNEWERFAEYYKRAGSPEKARLWSQLTDDQKSYVKTSWGLREPNPKADVGRRESAGFFRRNVRFVGIAAVIILMGFCVALLDQNDSKSSKTSTKSARRGPTTKSGVRVWTPEQLTGEKIATSSSGSRKPGSSSVRKTTVPKEYVYAKSAVNLRSGPGTNYSIIRKTHAGERLQYTSMEDDWYKLVREGNQASVYIHSGVVLSEWEKEMRDDADLALLSWSWHSGHGYATAEGKIKNVSSRTLKNVQAVVEFLAADGTFITSDTGLAEYNSILPGQTSPFRVMARWNPAMKKARIDFKTMFGGTLEWYKE